MQDGVTAVKTGDSKAFKDFLKDALDNEDVAREAMGEPRRDPRGDRGRRGRDRGGEDEGGRKRR